MATFRKVHVSFWGDPYIQSLSPEQKYFYLYLLTNERTRQCGIYEISKKQISYDTGYNIDTVSILLKYFINTKKILYSEATSEIAIKNWRKFNDNPSPKVQVLVNQEIKLIKDRTLILYLYPNDTVSIGNRPKEEEIEEEVEREIEDSSTSLNSTENRKKTKTKKISDDTGTSSKNDLQGTDVLLSFLSANGKKF